MAAPISPLESPPNLSGQGSGGPQNPTSSEPTSATTLRQFACTRCQHRKVKCDRGAPCENCSKGEAECVYVDPPPSRRRKRKAPVDGDLVARLDQAEAMLRSRGVDIDAAFGARPPAPPEQTSVPAKRAILEENNPRPRKGRLVADGDGWKYVEDPFWSVGLSEEFREARSNHYSDGAGLLFGLMPDSQTVRLLHPRPEHMFMLWNIFRENVNPLMSLIHESTFGEHVKNASSDILSIEKNIEPLLFAVYGAAVSSLTDDDCQRRFGDSKAELGARYLMATQQALVLAGLMKTTNLMVLQAFVLSLMSMREHYDSRALLLLAGVAGKIGQRMGVHRDGSLLGLNPFETEMRRRLFWPLIYLEVQTSRLSGMGHAAFSMDWDTFLPLNVNDCDLFPDMTHKPIDKTGITEATFCRMAAEFSIFLGACQKKMDLAPHWKWDQSGGLPMPFPVSDVQIAEFESRLENEFLKYCDPLIPVQHLISIMTRLLLCKLKLLGKKARGRTSMPQAEKDLVFENAVKIMEYDGLANAFPSLEKFLWYVRYNFQIEPFIYLICDLRTRPTGNLADRAWTQIVRIFTCYSAMASSTQNPVYMAMGKVVLEAWEVRRKHPGFSGDEPDILRALRARKDASENVAGGVKAQAYDFPKAHTYDQPPPGFVHRTSDINAPFEIPTPADSSSGVFPSEDWAYWDTILQEFELPPADEFLNSFLDVTEPPTFS